MKKSFIADPLLVVLVFFVIILTSILFNVVFDVFGGKHVVLLEQVKKGHDADILLAHILASPAEIGDLKTDFAGYIALACKEVVPFQDFQDNLEKKIVQTMKASELKGIEIGIESSKPPKCMMTAKAASAGPEFEEKRYGLVPAEIVIPAMTHDDIIYVKLKILR